MKDQNGDTPQSDAQKTGFLDRTFRNLKNAWRNLAESSYDADSASSRPDLPDADLDKLRGQMRACLETRGGEVSARARAAALGHVYLALEREGRDRFLGVVARDFDVSAEAIDHAVTELRNADGPGARRAAEDSLRHALEAPRIKLLTQFNALPDGIKLLVDMRAELLALKSDDPALIGLEQDLKRLLTDMVRRRFSGPPAHFLGRRFGGAIGEADRL